MKALALLNYLAPLGVGLACLAWAARLFKSTRLAQVVAVAGLAFSLFLVVREGLSPPEGRFDFTAFYEAGGDVLAGRDALAINAEKPLPSLNPPTAYPLFAAFALLPYLSSFFILSIVNGACLVASVLLACRFLNGEEGETKVDRTTCLLLLATLGVSNAARACITSGQLAISTMFFLFAALEFKRNRRPIAAGVAVAFATIKVGTTAPFLVLFLERRDVKTWVALVLVSLGLTLATGSPRDLPRQTVEWLGLVSKMSEPGQVNDFAYTSTLNDDMISLDHAFYRLGLRTRASAKSAQAVALGIIGLALAWEVVVRRRLSRAAAAAASALYASLFLYHRLGDMVILALPFAWFVAEARASNGGRRVRLVVGASALLAVFFLQRRVLAAARWFTVGRPGLLGELIQAVVLPYAAWLLLAALVIVWFDGGRRSNTTPFVDFAQGGA